MNKSQEQWASLGDLSLVTCLPKPWTCGPEGASLSVWMKIEDCSENGTDSYISSMSWGSNGFQVRCHHGKLRYRCVSPFTVPKGSFNLRITFGIKLVNVENVAVTYFKLIILILLLVMSTFVTIARNVSTDTTFVLQVPSQRSHWIFRQTRYRCPLRLVPPCHGASQWRNPARFHGLHRPQILSKFKSR